MVFPPGVAAACYNTEISHLNKWSSFVLEYEVTDFFPFLWRGINSLSMDKISQRLIFIRLKLFYPEKHKSYFSSHGEFGFISRRIHLSISFLLYNCEINLKHTNICRNIEVRLALKMIFD